MASIHYQPGYMRPTRSSYHSIPRGSTSSMVPLERTQSGNSMMSGIKSIFCSKSNYTSSSHVYTRAAPEKQFLRHPPRVTTSDLPAAISPQLEDRLLQLADRSRRLGVHRFSRTRNSLVLNEPVVEPRIPLKRLCPSNGSGSSLSTRSSYQVRE